MNSRDNNFLLCPALRLLFRCARKVKAETPVVTRDFTIVLMRVHLLIMVLWLLSSQQRGFCLPRNHPRNFKTFSSLPAFNFCNCCYLHHRQHLSAAGKINSYVCHFASSLIFWFLASLMIFAILLVSVFLINTLWSLTQA